MCSISIPNPNEIAGYSTHLHNSHKTGQMYGTSTQKYTKFVGNQSSIIDFIKIIASLTWRKEQSIIHFYKKT